MIKILKLFCIILFSTYVFLGLFHGLYGLLFFRKKVKSVAMNPYIENTGFAEIYIEYIFTLISLILDKEKGIYKATFEYTENGNVYQAEAYNLGIMRNLLIKDRGSYIIKVSPNHPNICYLPVSQLLLYLKPGMRVFVVIREIIIRALCVLILLCLVWLAITETL